MERKTLTCICCPIGCTIEAELEGNHVLSVRGNSCPRGEKYAKSELSNPVRTLTSTVGAHGEAQRVRPLLRCVRHGKYPRAKCLTA